MNKFLIYVALSLGAGIAVGAWLMRDAPSMSSIETQGSSEPGTTSFDQTAGIEERISALERAVSTEREARRILEDELLALYTEIEGVQREERAAEPVEIPPEAAADFEPPAEDPSMRERRREENRKEALVEAGFAPARADYIIERESALQYERMQAIYAARNSDNPRERFESIQNPGQALRAELGDTDYQRYLEATGQPTSVGVRSIMASSPAQAAGLQPGDEIVGYNGERIFGANELMMRAMESGNGESVTIDILRDGVPMQVTVPRGPIGIQIGPAGGRGR